MYKRQQYSSSDSRPVFQRELCKAGGEGLPGSAGRKKKKMCIRDRYDMYHSYVTQRKNISWKVTPTFIGGEKQAGISGGSQSPS